MSAITLSANPLYHSRIKHLDTDYHFVRERVHQGDLLVEYLSTDEQTTDILTKGLHSPTFTRHCFKLLKHVYMKALKRALPTYMH